MAGLTLTGFEKKIYDEIHTDIEGALRTALGSGINTLAPSVIGTILEIFTERESLLWDLAEEVYFSQYPNTATGIALDNVVALTGITRLAAVSTRQLGQLLYGTAGTLVPLGTVYSVSGNPSARFNQDNAVTLVAGADEVQTLTFSAIANSGTFKLRYEDETTALLAFNSTGAQIATALNALSKLSGVIGTGSLATSVILTFAVNDGKQNHPLLLVIDNLLLIVVTPIVITVTQTAQGVPQGEVSLTAQAPGATQALEGMLTVIETPIAGLGRVHNPQDAIIGRETETDNQLRIRRRATLQVAGAATMDAIRSQLLNLVGVTSVIGFENKTLVVDIDGRPGKSYEMVVQGGTPQEITQNIWDTKPAGIQTFGNQTGTAIDSQGVGQIMNWSRPTDVPIYVQVDITDLPTFPVTGQALVKQAIINHINGLGIGSDVIVYPGLICAIGTVPGIEDIVVRIGLTVLPTLDNNIPIAAAQIAVTDGAKVIVNII